MKFIIFFISIRMWNTFFLHIFPLGGLPNNIFLEKRKQKSINLILININMKNHLLYKCYFILNSIFKLFFFVATCKEFVLRHFSPFLLMYNCRCFFVLNQTKIYTIYIQPERIILFRRHISMFLTLYVEMQENTFIKRLVNIL